MRSVAVQVRARTRTGHPARGCRVSSRPEPAPGAGLASPSALGTRPHPPASLIARDSGAIAEGWPGRGTGPGAGAGRGNPTGCPLSGGAMQGTAPQQRRLASRTPRATEQGGARDSRCRPR
eukprot:ctg_1471.g495